ncbi:MAG: alpha/beta hydrolase family esterase [Myxococcota bacterium]
MRALTVSFALLVVGCSAPSNPDAGVEPCTPRAGTLTSFGGARPVRLQAPDGGLECSYPLVIVLHGYGVGGPVQAAYLGLETLVDGRHALLAAPDGTVDDAGYRFWNTGNASCCDFFGHAPDDVGYVRQLIHDIRADWPVDPQRIMLVGHSNGGFFAHRLACELEEVTHVVSLAGTEDTASPRPCARGPVRVLQIHGRQDETVFYDGGSKLLAYSADYVGAEEMTSRWAARNGCAAARDGGSLDLESTLPGSETTVRAYDGCRDGGDVTLWTIEGGSHVPSVGNRLPAALTRWGGL